MATCHFYYWKLVPQVYRLSAVGIGNLGGRALGLCAFHAHALSNKTTKSNSHAISVYLQRDATRVVQAASVCMVAVRSAVVTLIFAPARQVADRASTILVCKHCNILWVY